MGMFDTSTSTSTSSTSKSKGKSSSRKYKPSSGMLKARKNKRAIRRIGMKIARWERNKSNPQKVAAGKSRNNWNTTGLKKQLESLERK